MNNALHKASLGRRASVALPVSRLNSIKRILLTTSGLAFALTCGGGARAQQGGAEGLRGTATSTGDSTGLNAPTDLRSANYGKPRKRVDPRTKYTGRGKSTGRRLPDLTPYSSAATARQAKTAAPYGAQPAAAVAAIPTIAHKARPKVDSDPFAPVGIGVGSLRLVPYADISTGYDSNPYRVGAPARGATTLRGEVGAAWNSDWSLHEFRGDIKTGYTKYLGSPLADRPDGQGKMSLRIDASRDTIFDFELRGQLDTQRPGSTELTSTSVKSRPIVASVGATAGGTQKFGNLEIGLHGTLDRTFYQDAVLNNGSKLLLNGNSFVDYGLRARVGYQISPGITPFVEAGVDARVRDVAIDDAGFARNSTGATARIGSTFELSRVLTGETAVGYAQRKYVDSRLPVLAGPTFDAALIWTASPLTTVTLRGATALSETTVANASGAVSRALTLDISHALMRNLTLGAAATFGVNDYQGVNLKETTFAGTLKADYKLSRSVSIRGSFTHERLKSTSVGSDYTANVFLLGLKFQR